MTQREQRLVIIVAGLVVVLGVSFLSVQIYNAFTRRARQLETVEGQLANSNRTKKFGNHAKEKIKQYAAAALPADSYVARSMYKDWLMKVVTEVGLRNPKVDAMSVAPYRDVYTIHPFTVHGEANIEQVTDLLYAIQSAGVLHRTKSITLSPQKDKKDITVTLVLEALAMPDAPERTKLSPNPNTLVDGQDREYYRSHIVGRNLAGPENHPPKFSGDAALVAYRGQRFEFTAKAEDPDKLDAVVKYEADISKLPGARMSGDRLEWTPTENGDYQVTIIARDNGFPSREAKREFKISVKDPPKVEAPKRSFDVAKHAYVTGVTEKDGEPEVWVTIRTEGRTLKLSIGEAFKVGDLEGKIAEVVGNRVIIDTGGEKITTRLGQPLVQ